MFMWDALVTCDTELLTHHQSLSANQQPVKVLQ